MALNFLVSKLGYTQSSTPNNTEVVDVEFGKSSLDNKEYFHAKHDMNSSQVLAATENGSDGHSNTNYNVSSGSYDPLRLDITLLTDI